MNNRKENEGAIEQGPKLNREVYIRTNLGAMRAKILDAEKSGDFKTVEVLWTHNGNGVGNVIRIDESSIAEGKPMKIAFSQDGGKTFNSETESGQLENFGAWENSEQITADMLISQTDAHSLSESLRDNPHADLSGTTESLLVSNRSYQEAMDGYEHVPWDFTQSNPELAKFNLLDQANANIGWKAHLNILPEYAQKVGTYLKENGYYHKYLTGGIGSEGKAFTIYFGAKSAMDKWAPVLSHDLEEALCKPLVKDEVEVAKGVVSRFTNVNVNKSNFAGEEFLQYGEYGVSARREFIVKKGGWRNIKTTEDKQELARDAFQHLSIMYGSYFHG